LERIRRWLSTADTAEFSSPDTFADAIVEEIKTAYQGSFTSPRAEAIVRRTTKDIYTFYRLRDTSVFGSGPVPRLRFGTADVRAVNFFNNLDGWYFSSFVDNRRDELWNFFRETYLEQGSAALRETTESIEAFRRAAGGKLDRVNDYGVKTIVRSSVQRIRIWAHIRQLGEDGDFRLARLIAVVDNRTTQICLHLDGKYIRLGPAVEAIDRLSKMDPGEFAVEIYKSPLGRAYAQDSVEYVKDRITNDVVDDSLVLEGRGFPPYHPNCRTRVAGIVEGGSLPETGAKKTRRIEKEKAATD
jgi:hypothetical protein